MVVGVEWWPRHGGLGKGCPGHGGLGRVVGWA